MIIEKTYDAYWQSGQHITKEWTLEFFDETLGILEGKYQVLDYGCGLGYSYQKILSQKVKKYIGADISLKAV
jgi:SAM-dependent methyltransferase